MGVHNRNTSSPSKLSCEGCTNYSCTNKQKQIEYNEFYVHGTVHLSNTDHINANEMQLFLYSLSMFIVFLMMDA